MVLMARSKQAILNPSSAESHEALTMSIISAIARVVYRRKRQKPWSMRNLGSLLQKRNGWSDFAPAARRFARVLAGFCASLARGAAARRLETVSQ
jgi:hypothetical protein